MFAGVLVSSPLSTLQQCTGMKSRAPRSALRAVPPPTPDTVTPLTPPLTVYFLLGAAIPGCLVMVNIYVLCLCDPGGETLVFEKYSQHFTNVKWCLRGLSCSM